MLPPALVPPSFDAGIACLSGRVPGLPSQAVFQAEIILHDAPVPEEIFSVAARWRGKRARGWRTPGPGIGLQGFRVVRLKGGDPPIFGPGGEEAQGLAAAGMGLWIEPAAAWLPMILVNDKQSQLTA
jgi:uroporphyrin-III C-methyltransferase